MHVIACRPVVAEGFPQDKEAIVEELGGQSHEALWMLTFSFEQDKPRSI
jgi:hypothetical protein